MERKKRHIDTGLPDYLKKELYKTTRKGDYYIRSGRGENFSIEVLDNRTFQTLFRFPDSGIVRVKHGKREEMPTVIFQGLKVPQSVGQSEDAITRDEIKGYLLLHGIEANIIFLDQRDSDEFSLRFTHDMRRSLKRK